MPFREKIAWISLAGLVSAFAPYFALLATRPLPARGFAFYSGGLLVGATLLTILVVTIGSVGAALTNVRDAQAPADERDRNVARRASATGYAVLMPLLFLALAGVFLDLSVGALANAVLAAIVLAELVRCTAQIILYRKGA